MLWLARRHEPRDGLGPFAAGASPAPLPRTSEVSFMDVQGRSNDWFYGRSRPMSPVRNVPIALGECAVVAVNAIVVVQ